MFNYVRFNILFILINIHAQQTKNMKAYDHFQPYGYTFFRPNHHTYII